MWTPKGRAKIVQICFLMWDLYVDIIDVIVLTNCDGLTDEG